MNAIDFNLSAATTAELVVFYNAHSGRPAIKKFSDRATGIARCAAIQAELAKAATQPEPAEETIMSEETTNQDPVVQQDEDISAVAEQEATTPTAEAEATTPTSEAEAEAKPYVAGTCPACGSTDLAPNGEAGTVAGDEQQSCNACGHAFWVENGAALATTRAEANKRIADAVAATWNDPAVKAKRMERHNIYVTDQTKEGAPEVYYKSVLEAFKALGLMISRHIKFRAACKAAGDAGLVYKQAMTDGTEVAYLFRAVEQPKAEAKPKAEKAPKAAKAEGSAATGKKRGRKSNAEKAAAAQEAADAQPVGSPEEVEVEEC